MDFFQIAFKKRKNVAVDNFKVTIKLYKKHAFQLSHGIKILTEATCINNTHTGE